MPTRKPRASELSYHTQGTTGERKIVAAHEGRVVGYMASEMQERSGGYSHRKLSLAWVDPSLQRRGIASTMLNLERQRTGYMPVGDTALSTAGQKFQRGTGVPKNPEGEVVGLPARAFAGASEGIQERQGHMLHAEQFPDWLVKASSPYKAPRRKPGDQPEQLHLFDPNTVPRRQWCEDCSSGLTPRAQRGEITARRGNNLRRKP